MTEANVGYATLGIIPSMKGMTGKIEGELKGLTRDRQVGVGLNPAGVQNGLSRVERSTEGSLGKIKGAFGAAGTAAGALFTAGATAAIAGIGLAAFGIGKFGIDAIGVASDVNEANSKVGVVFGENADIVRNFAANSARDLGMAKGAALDAAGTYGNLFRAMGIGSSTAADMSTKLVGLASDLASFNNADPTDVLEALRSGLTGEVEPLRRFGVNLNEDRINAEALAMGLVKPTQNATKLAQSQIDVEKATKAYNDALREHGRNSLEAREAAADLAKTQDDAAAAARGSVPDLDAAQKAQAAYSLILKDTSLAQGDFARTSDGAANKQRVIAAQWEDLKGAIGEKFLPIAQKAMAWFSDTLLPLFERAAAPGGPIDRIATLFSGVADAIGTGDWSAVGEQLSGLWPTVQGWLSGLWANIASWFEDNKGPLAAKGQELLKGFIEWIYGLAGKAYEALGPFITGIGEWVQNTAVPYIEQHWQEWVGAFIGWFGPMWLQLQLKLGEFLAKVGWWIISDALPWIASKSLEWAAAFVDWVTRSVADLPGKLAEWIGALGSWVKDTALPNLVSFGSQMLDSFIKWLSELPGKAAAAGGDLISGLWEGLKAKLGEILNGIGGLAAPLVDAFKAAFGIHSPSRVMMPVGAQIAAGIAAGFHSYNLVDELNPTGTANVSVAAASRSAGGAPASDRYLSFGAAPTIIQHFATRNLNEAQVAQEANYRIGRQLTGRQR